MFSSKFVAYVAGMIDLKNLFWIDYFVHSMMNTRVQTELQLLFSKRIDWSSW